MQIIDFKIENIKPYPKNAKKHPQKQVEQITDSIKEFGWGQPIVIDQNNEIIVGHGRYEAAKRLKLSDVPILQVNLTKEQAKAYRLADNKLNESEWDMGLVIEELKGLSDEMFDLTGFDKDLIIEPDEKDDIIPENVEPKAKLGDLYKLGNHRVLCGDSTKIEDVERLMDGKKADMVFTSPPYSDMREYEGGKDLSVGNIIKFIQVFEPFCTYQVINLGIQRKEGAIYRYWDDYIDFAESVGYKLLSWNIWNREEARSVGQATAMFPIQHEFIFVFGYEKGELKKTVESKTAGRQHTSGQRQKDGSMVYREHKTHPYKAIGTVLTVGVENTNKTNHPAVYPVILPEEYIKAMAQSSVIDPFLGSGSTLIACEKTNRICYGMELDPKYVSVIIERWCKYTGITKIEKNGETMEWENG